MTARRMRRPDIQQRTEIALHVPNDLDTLAKLFATMARERPRLLGWCFCSNHHRATAWLITAAPSATLQALRMAGFEAETNPVVVVGEEHRGVPTAGLAAELRAAGIQISDAYTCCGPPRRQPVGFEDE